MDIKEKTNTVLWLLPNVRGERAIGITAQTVRHRLNQQRSHLFILQITESYVVSRDVSEKFGCRG